MSCLEASVNPEDSSRKTTDPSHRGQINTSFFICLRGLPSPLHGVPEFSIRYEEDKIFFYSSRVRGFQMVDLVGKTVGVTGTKHKYNKLVRTTS